MGGTVLLTGATGYVGGRLLAPLRERGNAVRAMSRRPDELRARLDPDVEVVGGDVLDRSSLDAALEGVEAAYYLIHSMGSAGDFQEQDREAAANFAAAASAAGVRRVIYLGGLGRDTDLSPHLESRQEVGRILREEGPPAIELRASVILGSGSLSFEMIRALVERLPVLVTPRWVGRVAQPIAVEDVLAYLLASLDVPLEGSEVVEIGGAEQVSYRGIMEEYARQRGLRRAFLPVPVLTPRLSSLWLGLVTPIYARVGRKLIDSLRYDTVVESTRADELFPGIRPMGVVDAVARSLAREDLDFARTRWSDARSAAGDPQPFGGERLGSRLVDTREVTVGVASAQAFEPVRRVGGKVGWYFGDALWRLRGFLDLLVGGPGLRRGRRDPATPLPGDAIDFWRVEAYEPGRLLRLRAEMRLPGRAWLQFEVEDAEEGRSRIRQTALFEPAGLAGLAYWYGLWPFHSLVFGGMLRGIAAAATGPRFALDAPDPGSSTSTDTFAMAKNPVPLDRPGLWSRIRRGLTEFLWVPAIMMLAAVVLAGTAIWFDRNVPGWIRPVRGLVKTYVFPKASSTNDFLGMETTGLITMTSITFSMLLLALQQSASLIGAQVVYSFLLRRRNQILMGYFLGATLFVLIVHAGTEEGFNPVLGAAVSLILTAAALAALAALVYTSVNQMRPQAVIENVRTLTLEARRRQRELLMASYRSPRYAGGTEIRIRTEAHGFVREIRLEPLKKALQGRRGEAEVELRLEVGDYASYGDELARVRAEDPAEAERLAGVTRKAIRLDSQRATERDPSFGVDQILMIGWSSGSTARHNPGVALDAVRNLRDIVARWTVNYEEVEGSDGTIPLVYPDGLVQKAIGAMEAIAVVATESMQSVTFEEVMHAYRHVFHKLPEKLQDRAAVSLCRLVTGLGDLLLTPQLESALDGVARTLRDAGYPDNADVVEASTREMASTAGTLAARSTRVSVARSDHSGS